ncbi:MAG: gliding motility-associated transport system ATP-binding protein [Pseudomonadota bacterium]|nr:gliding motility-associated transport system ATP-binding protein [Pseudomonadota bacterium]
MLATLNLLLATYNDGMTNTALISAQNLHRSYASLPAVQGVSFELQQGDILGFLGPNGAGKSTTMQMLAGVLAPSAGRILINGIDLLDEPQLAKKQIGYLPEIPPLYGELSVDEYLLYAGKLRGLKPGLLKAALDEAKQRCGLNEVGKKLIANLSKGYQQRVGIAQAIIHKPAVIILDEPTVGLDPIQIREIRALIRELGQQHGIILSTHILPEVQTVCNRVQIIHRGQLVFSDSMQTLEHRMHSSRLIVAFDRPPPVQHLQSIAGVNRVEPIGNGRFRLHLADTQPLGELIASAAVAQDWGLQELTPEKNSLEQIFVELTAGEIRAA